MREYLSFLRLLPEMEKIAEIDVNSIKGDDSESDFIIEKLMTNEEYLENNLAELGII